LILPDVPAPLLSALDLEGPAFDDFEGLVFSLPTPPLDRPLDNDGSDQSVSPAGSILDTALGTTVAVKAVGAGEG